MNALAVALLFSVFPLEAQTALTVSASRSLSIAPDEAAVSIQAVAELSRTQDEVVAALAGVGVKSEHLTGLRTADPEYDYQTGRPKEGAPRLQYQFGITIPLATWNDVLARLDVMAKTPPEALESVRFTATISVSAKAAEQARLAVLPEVIAEARRNADTLALVAGFRVGAIQGLTEAHYGYSNGVSVTVTARFAKN